MMVTSNASKGSPTPNPTFTSSVDFVCVAVFTICAVVSEYVHRHGGNVTILRVKIN